MKGLRVLTLLPTLISVVSGGTESFHLADGRGWLDSNFFTVVTISTVGYGELGPATQVGRIGATVLIFFRLAIFAVAIQQFGMFAMRQCEQHTEWLIARLSGETDPASANNDKDPST